MVALQEDERLDREREFHNRRFADDESRDQEKYYYAIRPAERRFRDKILKLSAGKDVLEYGCSTGSNSLQIARIARSVSGIDISEVAVAKAAAFATEDGLVNTFFAAMNAEKMDFPDQSFDVIFGSGIIHHLDIARCAREIHRVLRPGGVAMFWEPMGHNPLINVYRYLTPSARTPDEHPLLTKDLALLATEFPRMKASYHGLTSLASVPVRNLPGAAILRAMLNGIDQVVFAMGPLSRMAWYVTLELSA